MEQCFCFFSGARGANSLASLSAQQAKTKNPKDKPMPKRPARPVLYSDLVGHCELPHTQARCWAGPVSFSLFVFYFFSFLFLEKLNFLETVEFQNRNKFKKNQIGTIFNTYFCTIH
jgi:hypothetical protein